METHGKREHTHNLQYAVILTLFEVMVVVCLAASSSPMLLLPKSQLSLVRFVIKRVLFWLGGSRYKDEQRQQYSQHTFMDDAPAHQKHSGTKQNDAFTWTIYGSTQ